MTDTWTTVYRLLELSDLFSSCILFIQKSSSIFDTGYGGGGGVGVEVLEKKLGRYVKEQLCRLMTSENYWEYNVNKTGPNTEPRGTPYKSGRGFEVEPLTMTD